MATDPGSIRTLVDLGPLRRWSTIRGWSTFDLAFAVLATAVYWVDAARLDDPTAAYVLAPAIGVALAVRSRNPGLSAAGLLTILFLQEPSSGETIASVAVLFPIATLAIDHRYVAAALATVGYLVANVRLGIDSEGSVELALWLSVGVFFVVTSARQGAANHLMHERERVILEQEAAQTLALRAEIDAERRRIAQGLDSIVTSALSAVRDELDAPGALDSDDELLSSLERAEVASRRSLAQLRGMVGALRSFDAAPSAPPRVRAGRTLHEVEAVVREAAPAATIVVDVAEPETVGPWTVMQLLAVVDEAVAMFDTSGRSSLTTFTVRDGDDHQLVAHFIAETAGPEEVRLGFPHLASLQTRMSHQGGHLVMSEADGHVVVEVGVPTVRVAR